MEESQLELRSEPVQEILGFIPHWIIRWGITVIAMTVLMLLSVSWIMRYPEIIPSRIVLVAEHPPVSVVARSSGKLSILVKENEPVKRDAYLGVIENPARVQDVLELRKQVEAFKASLEKFGEPTEMNLGTEVTLGELQAAYSGWRQSHLDYRFLIQGNYYQEKIGFINSQIASQKDFIKRLAQQKELLSQDVELAKKKYDNYKGMAQEGLISQDQQVNAESLYLQKKYALEGAENSIIQSNVQLAEYEKTIADLTQQYDERKRGLRLALERAYKEMESQLAVWEQKYVLKAPSDGHVSFFKFWSDDQFVNAGNEVMTIVPGSQSIVGRVYLPQAGAGKVKTGHRVKVKFDSFPYQEFGVVEGKVESISLVARDNTYLIIVSLPGGLKTSYNKTLEFKQEMQGSAEIVTEDLRLIERIFNQLRYIFTTSVSTSN